MMIVHLCRRFAERNEIGAYHLLASNRYWYNSAVLLLIDEPYNVGLSKKRYRISFARTGDAALSAVERDRGDAILLDLRKVESMMNRFGSGSVQQLEDQRS
jgi:hypothetical protein